MSIFRVQFSAAFLLLGFAYIPHIASATQEGATYVGSAQCQKCHQKISKEWKQTLHAQMATDVSKNPNAIVGDFETPSEIRSL